MRAIPILIVLLSFAFTVQAKSHRDFDEIYRPQIHYSAPFNWIGDPCGFIYQNGEYHLFYLFNPTENNSGHSSWGHAVSKNLIDWESLPVAINADPIDTSDVLLGSVMNGSVIIDRNNILQKQVSETKTMVAFYTVFKKGLKLSFSIDNGRTWKLSEQSLQIDSLNSECVDPKVIWYEPTQTWVMILSQKSKENAMQSRLIFYNSKDLIHWSYKDKVPGFFENPNLFELKVNNRENDRHWVLAGGNGSYLIGSFDGEKFKSETGILKYEYGQNYSAPVTTQTPDGRVIQIAGLGGAAFPNMPFNGQMAFPCELSLRRFSDGIHLCRAPARELESLYEKVYEWEDKNLYPGLGQNLLQGIDGDCFRIVASIDMKSSDTFGFLLRKGKENMGTEVMYTAKNQLISCMQQNAQIEPTDGMIDFDILLDRASVEVFSSNGKVSITNAFNPEPKDKKTMLFTIGGELLVKNLKIYRLRSIYEPLK